MSEFVTTSKSRTVTAHGIFNRSSVKVMVRNIISDIVAFFRVYAPVGIVLAVLAVGIFLGCLLIGKFCLHKELPNRNFVLWKSGYIFLLVLYLYIVLGITILSRSESGTRKVSFQLFRTFRNTFFARKQIYENVLLFVPLGVLLYQLAKPFRKIYFSIAIGAGCSLLIEVTQWVTKTGCFELDDVLTNTLGMLLGCVICIVMRKIKVKGTQM